jgi:hypothetical protein
MPTDVRTVSEADHEDMSSYAVVWSEPQCEPEAGKLELEPESIRFEGSHRGGHGCVHRVRYDDIAGVRIGHHAGERLFGKPAVVVELDEDGPVRIGSVDGIGTLTELADELTRMTRN